MANDRCPWCGAEATHRFGRVEFRCGSYPEEQSPICARITKLEAALRGLLHNMQQHNCAGCHIEKAREALSNAHGPGTMAGDAAREGLER